MEETIITTIDSPPLFADLREEIAAARAEETAARERAVLESFRTDFLKKVITSRIYQNETAEGQSTLKNCARQIVNAIVSNVKNYTDAENRKQFLDTALARVLKYEAFLAEKEKIKKCATVLEISPRNTNKLNQYFLHRTPVEAFISLDKLTNVDDSAYQVYLAEYAAILGVSKAQQLKAKNAVIACGLREMECLKAEYQLRIKKEKLDQRNQSRGNDNDTYLGEYIAIGDYSAMRYAVTRMAQFFRIAFDADEKLKAVLAIEKALSDCDAQGTVLNLDQLPAAASQGRLKACVAAIVMAQKSQAALRNHATP